MKNIHKSFVTLACLMLATLCVAKVNAQKTSVKDLIESRHYVFRAQTAIPTTGASRPLTTEYTLRVDENAIVSDLPFFGRAYSVPYGATEGGFNFTSTKFDYAAHPGKKGGWEISIKPKDVQDFREFFLTVSDSGFGTLLVTTNNRQPMSFTGYIDAVK